MAYKRYVHKKGKRHGPYYYKNVRSGDGRVRSIYLGKVTSRSKKPLEVTIVFLALLLIIISVLFFIQNRNLVLSQIVAEEAAVPFEVDQILIKVLVKANEFIEKEIRVMNVGDEEKSIEVDISGLSDIIDVLDNTFTIKPGQTKIVRLNFSSFDKTEGVEQVPGVYIGKIRVRTGSYEKSVPVVVEIESKNVLFDMNLNPVARDRSVLQGSSTTFEIRVFNLQSIESFNVDMDFFAKDVNGNTIISERESVVVKTQASFFKTLRIPKNLKTGNYIFVAQASLGNSIGTASYLFEVESPPEEKRFTRFLGFCRNDPLCWMLSVIVLLLMFAIGAYAYFFIGAIIYQKLFGISLQRRRTAEETKVAQVPEEKKENPIISSFRHFGERIRKARERRAKRKLEFEKEKLKLKEKLEEKKEKLKEKLEEKKEKLKEKKEKLKEKLEEKRAKKGSVIRSFRHFGERIRRAGERRAKRKLEFEKEKLKLKEKKEKLKLEEKRARKGSVGKCRRLIDGGYRALDKSRIGKADKIYADIMERYINLPSERKVEIFKGINSFYKSLLLRKQQLKYEESERKRKEEEEIKRKESERENKEKSKQEDKARREKLKEDERKRKRKLIEENRKQRRKKVFNFFHNLGLVKTEKEKREIERNKQKERKCKELERKKEQQQRKKEEEEKKKNKLEEERQREREIKRREEENTQRQLQEKTQKEIEKKRQEEDLKKQKELEIKRREEERIRKQQERKRREFEEKKHKEEAKKQKELEIKRKEAEERRKEKEKERKLEEIKALEENINGKNAGVNKLKEKIKKTLSAKNVAANEISRVEKDIRGLKNEKNIIFKVYNEDAGSKKQLDDERRNRLFEWRKNYDAKLKEKNHIKKDVKQEYDNEVKNLESELEGLSHEDRAEQEKWKRLELKAKYKLGEKEREKTIKGEIKDLQTEKRGVEKEFNEKKKGFEKGVAGKDLIQRQKYLDDLIRGYENDIEELKKKISTNERALERYESNIEKLEQEKEHAKSAVMDIKKELGGLNYLASFFKFAKKAEPEEKEILKEAEEDKQKEFEKKKQEEDLERKETGEKKKQEGKEEKYDLEKSLKELGEISEQRKKEKKPNIIRKVFGLAYPTIRVKKEKETEQPEESKAKIDLKRRLKGKSRTFLKCHKLLSIADKALQNEDIPKAKKLYLKSRSMYIKLEYLERKEIYADLTAIYNKLRKGGK